MEGRWGAGDSEEHFSSFLLSSCSGSLCIWRDELAYRYMEAYFKSSDVVALEERFLCLFSLTMHQLGHDVICVP